MLRVFGPDTDGIPGTVAVELKLVGEGAGQGGDLVAGVGGGCGLDEGEDGFFGGAGVVARAVGDDEGFTGVEGDRAAVALSAAYGESAGEDEEELVFVVVSVPGEFAVHADDFQVVIVDCGYYARMPEVGETLGQGAEVEGLIVW